MKHAYSNNLDNYSLAILGPLPPPLGGVSVHMQRVIAKLKKQNNTIYHFDSTQELRYRFLFLYLLKLAWFIIRAKPDLVMYHTTYLRNALSELRALTFLKKIIDFKLLLIEHDCRFAYHLSDQQKKSYQKILAHTHKQVCIGSRTLESFKVNNLLCAYNTLESAFLPPDVSDRNKLLQEYPPGLFAFIKQHTPIVLANAFQLSLIDGKDLYGFDQLVDAFAMYRKHSLQAGLVLMLVQKGDEKLYDNLLKQIVACNIKNNVYILLGNRTLWPLFEYADMFVRPTLSDGASVSVQESLYFNVPVIASDVCWRPPECMLYKSGDTNALYCALKKELYAKTHIKRNNLYSQPTK